MAILQTSGPNTGFPVLSKFLPPSELRRTMVSPGSPDDVAQISAGSWGETATALTSSSPGYFAPANVGSPQESPPLALTHSPALMEPMQMVKSFMRWLPP